MSNTAPLPIGQGMLEIGGETTFNAGAAGSYIYLESIAVDRSGLTYTPVRSNRMRQEFYTSGIIPGARNGSLVTRHELFGFNSSVPTGAPSHTTIDGGGTAFDAILGAFASSFGQISSGGYNGTASFTGSTTAQVAVTDASGGLAGFAAGRALAWALAGGAGYEVGWPLDITTGADPDTAQLLQAATAAPQGSVLWGSHTVYVINGQPYLDGTPRSFALRVSGANSDDRLLCTGCVPTNITIDFVHRDLAILEITWGVASWSEPGSGGDPNVQSWTFPPGTAVMNGLGGFTANLGSGAIPFENLRFDLGLRRRPTIDYNANDGIGGWSTIDIQPKVTFLVHRDVSEQVTDYANRTARAFTFSYGTQPGQMFSLCLPNAQIVEFPGFQDQDGAIMAPITLEPQSYNGDTGSAPANTVCRFAFL